MNRTLTVFVIGCDKKRIQRAITLAERGEFKFDVKIIYNIYPMSAAFNQMHALCTTDYFIQLDEDMLVDNRSIAELHADCMRSPINCYRVSRSLFQRGFGRAGAIKCWKTWIFRIVRFRDVRTVDRDLVNRLRLLGLTTRHKSDLAGEHLIDDSEDRMLIKLKADTEKWIFLKRPYERYLENVLSTRDTPYADTNLAIIFVLLGIFSPESRLRASKNELYEYQIYTRVMQQRSKEKIVDSFKAYDLSFLYKLIRISYGERLKGSSVESIMRMWEDSCPKLRELIYVASL